MSNRRRQITSEMRVQGSMCNNASMHKVCSQLIGGND